MDRRRISASEQRSDDVGVVSTAVEGLPRRSRDLELPLCGDVACLTWLTTLIG